jgi:glutamyl-tRNA synthetase
MDQRVRVRFAPSPTGPLNIGGLRTALYDYLFARKHGGDFILRIEDTDKNREVPGTEQYILDALKWVGIEPDEYPGVGGEKEEKYGPYRQSDRKHLYLQYAEQMIEAGHAYYAFDTSEEIDAMRTREEEAGNPGAKYNHATRDKMRNSLTLDAEEVSGLRAKGENVVIRLKMPEDEVITFTDIVRDEVSFKTGLLDDKVMIKADGMPTYHLANIVDDHLMEISHVIRGEEWLSSTAHHIYMYQILGWTPPQFAHLSLILKPVGKGKLSKRDSAKFGFPVFPLDWHSEGELQFEGFKEYGFLPEALINFLAFLGWNPGTDQEIFSLEELTSAFNLEKVVKSGARFDIEKAKWYNQQYIMAQPDNQLAEMIQGDFEGVSADKLSTFCGLMKERVENLNDFKKNGYFFFDKPAEYDAKTIRKKYKEENDNHFSAIAKKLEELESYTTDNIQSAIKGYIGDNELSFGAILPILRVAMTGTMKGPDIFATMELLGKEESLVRLTEGIEKFKTLSQQTDA